MSVEFSRRVLQLTSSLHLLCIHFVTGKRICLYEKQRFCARRSLFAPSIDSTHTVSIHSSPRHEEDPETVSQTTQPFVFTETFGRWGNDWRQPSHRTKAFALFLVHLSLSVSLLFFVLETLPFLTPYTYYRVRNIPSLPLFRAKGSLTNSHSMTTKDLFDQKLSLRVIRKRK